jgi:DDE superfamily endonuclease
VHPRYEKTAAGIPATNVLNYDETNLQDNPKAAKAIYPKGARHAEKVQDHSKSCISLMICGSAAGVLLPAFVVYQAKSTYEGWKEGGPPGAQYRCSPSGWFDMPLVEDWFKTDFLPHIRRLPGKKLLVGDNLSSHISLEVIRLCKENDVEFVCFPANSTHLIQPLDVGFFAQMKRAWRNQLRSYAAEDPDAKALEKTRFPAMLNELLESLNPKRDLPKAFEKCGLLPINREKVLKEIPSALQTEEIAQHVDAGLIEKLQIRRFGGGKKKTRGKKVAPGASYTSVVDDSGSEKEDDVREQEHEQEEEQEHEQEHEQEQEESDEELPELPPPSGSTKKGFVVAVYEGQWFLAEVVKDQAGIPTGYTKLSYMVIKGVNRFAWGPADVHTALNSNILMNDVVPEPVNSRGMLALSKKDLKLVTVLMVVVYFLFFIGAGLTQVCSKLAIFWFTFWLKNLKISGYFLRYKI